MKQVTATVLSISALILTGCGRPVETGSRFEAAGTVPSGTPAAVILTCYSTTLIANGTDRTLIRIAVTDSLSRQIRSATDSVRIYMTGEGRIAGPDGNDIPMRKDTAGLDYHSCRLAEGICRLMYITGKKPGIVKIEARSGRLWPGSHEIHTLPAAFVRMQPEADQLGATSKTIGRMIGADISFLPQMEESGQKFYENGKEIDAIRLLKEHGFNFIRLRIFVNPENEKGYAPGKGYCGLAYTLDMARRIREAGMSLLLDFHYSDYWADPQQQNKPLAWQGLGFDLLGDSVRTYTARVLTALKAQGTPPAMVQVGNEINHGLLWPDGHISQPDRLAALLKAGAEGVNATLPDIPVMMHIALGGQNDEARFWLDNMIARGVKFDIIGLSYYPRWHGTLDDLEKNLADLAARYNKPVNVVEYSDFKRQVNEITFGVPGGMGKGTCIWEPLNFRSGLFTRGNETTELIKVYDSLAAAYLK